jgi:hypothetical protein
MNKQELKELLAKKLEEYAWYSMESNEYNFHDTALKSKTLMLAAKIVRETELD